MTFYVLANLQILIDKSLLHVGLGDSNVFVQPANNTTILEAANLVVEQKKVGLLGVLEKECYSQRIRPNG